MSRFLFSTFGSLGDVNPYIAVARALARRGHEPVIAAAREHRSVVEGAGVAFAPTAPSLTELGGIEDIVRKLFAGPRGPEVLVRRLVMPHLRASYEDLLRASDGAALLVAHPLSFTLPLVAERLGIPWVSTTLSPMSFMSPFDPPVIPGAPWLNVLRVFGPTPFQILFAQLRRAVKNWEAPLQALRAELGLPPSEKMAMFEGQYSPSGHLALFDRQIARPQADWPDNARVCGCPVFDPLVPNGGMPEDPEPFLNEGDAPVVFALGSSAVWRARDFWKNAAASARLLKKRAILITGPSTPGALPEGVKAFAWLPYSGIFSRAAAVVHHGGTGTLARALRAGRPQLIVPVAFDQPDNARRAASLGLARVLPFGKISVPRLASQLHALFERPGYANAARVVAKELSGEDGAAQAAMELIRCLEKAEKFSA